MAAKQTWYTVYPEQHDGHLAVWTNERPETEIQAKFLVSRCQSVPAATVNSSVSLAPKMGSSLETMNNSLMDVSQQLLDESTNLSKSYPATPICSQPFQFPPSPPSSTKQQMVFTGDDIISGNVFLLLRLTIGIALFFFLPFVCALEIISCCANVVLLSSTWVLVAVLRQV